MAISRRNVFLLILFFGLILLSLFSLYFDDHYLLISSLFIVVSILLFFARFERKQRDTKLIVLIAVLAAIAAVSRVPFAAIPSVQPTSFVIIASSLVFGSEAGFMMGAIAALVSNIFLGQGPWTPWQMFCWGLIGFTAGWLKDTWWMKQAWGRLLFGFVWGFLFGWIMNLSFVINYVADFSWAAFGAAYVASGLFDLLHALSNVFFLALFGAGWIKILERFKVKYGM
jgi:energy-coupling factor transport system substrate-specific component